MDPLVEFLDRQVDFLLRQPDSATFLIQVEPFLGTLRTEPQLAAYLDDVLEEVVDIVGAMEQVDAQLTSELVELRSELVELWPQGDDSHFEPLSESESGAEKLIATLRYRGSLAYFDEWAATEPPQFNGDGAGGLAKTLLSILQGKTPPTGMTSRRQVLVRAAERRPVPPTVQPVQRRRPRARRKRQRRTSSTRGGDGLGTFSAAMTTPFVSCGCAAERLPGSRSSSWRP